MMRVVSQQPQRTRFAHDVSNKRYPLTSIMRLLQAPNTSKTDEGTGLLERISCLDCTHGSGESNRGTQSVAYFIH